MFRETPLHAGTGGATFTDYVYGAGLLAKYDHSPSGSLRSDYHVDHLGTPRLKLDGNGQITRYYMYYPYGRMFNEPAGTDLFPMRYTGHERDLLTTESAVDDTENHHARRFSLLTARYQGPDPIGGDILRPQSWNLFAYVEGNPINFVDPSGLKKQKDCVDTYDDEGRFIQGVCVSESGGNPGRPPDPPPIGPGDGRDLGPSPDRRNPWTDRPCDAIDTTYFLVGETLSGTTASVDIGGAVYPVPGVFGVGGVAGVTGDSSGKKAAYGGGGVFFGFEVEAAPGSFNLWNHGEATSGLNLRFNFAFSFGILPIGLSIEGMRPLSGGPSTVQAGFQFITGAAAGASIVYVGQEVHEEALPCR